MARSAVAKDALRFDRGPSLIVPSGHLMERRVRYHVDPLWSESQCVKSDTLLRSWFSPEAVRELDFRMMKAQA